MSLESVIDQVGGLAQEFQVAPPRRNENATTDGFLEAAADMESIGLHDMAMRMKKLYEKAKHLGMEEARSIAIELGYYMLPELWKIKEKL